MADENSKTILAIIDMKLNFAFLHIFFSKIITTPLTLIETSLIARILGPENFGQWSLILAAAIMLHTLFINWTHSITLKFGVEEWTEYKSLYKTFNTRLPILIAALTLICFLVFYTKEQFLNFYSIKEVSIWFVLLQFITIWITLESQSNLQASLSFIIQAIATPLISCISIIFLLIIFYNRTHDFKMILIGLVLIKTTSWGTILFGRLKTKKYFIAASSIKDIKNVLAFGWPVIPTLFCGYLSDWGDHILIAKYCSLKEIGFWGAAYQIMLGIISINSIFVTILLPWIISKNQLIHEIPQYYLKKVIPFILSLWLPVVIIIITFFPFLFFLCMGSDYPKNNFVLSTLSMAIITNVFSSLYSIVFNLQNRLKIILVYNFLLVSVNLSVSMILIPKFGLLGASIGTALSYLTGHMLYIIDQHRYLNISAKKVITFFSLSLFAALLLFISGMQLFPRIASCTISLFILIIFIRKMQTIDPNLIKSFFTGIFHPIGILLNKFLVTTNAENH